ncbi:CCA tRNA nucleotidyltransferase [Staphylococcus intermedius]|uniref:CCA-adding enzyme n=1 Tax=Staphylococcus intermedius NCTC 11048 TaxID=1141106 RepID=A0A380G8A2_STAIN|nr:CCA tRNA nucleotidyltransferase [Staphylococcus intermedius]PCF64896.1 CCA tRNA nucleotidyltransferase [Staphylococcus intermedius]PCF80506.1 CCA tRNA nucleotidyltransferase [Staphylococcus intermedius]PCF81856.1 CCA tRNA nucleotidyltransferase [Staphylococcus intermedius]PCF88193.1 CCA tRNA nucleotidyltransferase [Staphylococcus intermedius]PCF88907.1 CCA tRNA nucleotidyltransferase [Staphylococcus intermedius]
MNRSQFELAKPILERLIQHGYEAYFVGGSVRDFIMNRPIHDVDMTTNATPDEIETLFEHTIPIGKEHGTINVVWNHENYEVTTFRAEAEYVDHRRPTEVYFVRDLYQDVERRDFTMNAIAMDIHYQRIDHFEGERDIEQRMIRTVGDAKTRFDEDALRILRGLRFKSQLGFTIEDATFEAMSHQMADLEYLSIERIMNELRLLVNGAYIAETLPLLHSLQMWRYIPYFRDIDVETMVLNTPIDIESFLAILSYRTDHQAFKPLKLSNVQVRTIQTLVSAIQSAQTIATRTQLQQFVYDFGIDVALKINALRPVLEDNQIHIASPVILNGAIIQNVWSDLPIQSRQDLAIDGQLLMQAFQLKGGPWIKEVLRRVECAVIQRQVNNQTEAIIEWVRTHVKIS